MGNTPATIRVVVFAAGKSTRMATGRSKMLTTIEVGGQAKPMILNTTDLMTSLGYQTIVLIGYDGTAVSDSLANAQRPELLKPLRVCRDDGADLSANTGGTLRNYRTDIVAELRDEDLLLLCVGDQPFMQFETLRDFVQRHRDAGADASILVADVRGTPMERSTYTRVSTIASGKMAFETPPKEGPFDNYSTLVDVGVVLITKASFLCAIERINERDVFSKLLCHLPAGHNNVNVVTAFNPYQFLNVNEKEDRAVDVPKPLIPSTPDDQSLKFVDKSEILLRWIEWNILDRRRTPFDIFAFPQTYAPEFEMDTTLFCRGTPACAENCTYRQKHMKEFLDQRVATYVVQAARSLGFVAVLFSGGGENLEREAYDNFIIILEAARKAGLRTNLATNPKTSAM